MEKLMAWLGLNKWRLIIGFAILLVGLIVALAARDSFLSWYYDRIAIEETTQPESDFQDDRDWLTCIYNCALQVSPKKPGVCARACDNKYTTRPTGVRP